MSGDAYAQFLKSKEFRIETTGWGIDDSLICPLLFPFQKDVVKWAVNKGRGAVFLDTGLGKTFIQLEWARLIGKQTLIVAPLSVARQTIQEGEKINVAVRYVRKQADMDDGINITNYEMIEHFSRDCAEAVVLDESSILKSLSGKTKEKLIRQFEAVQFKLCCTATPAPNDYTELGNHAEFLNICSMQEMLAMFFINANKEHTFIYENRIITKKGSNKGGQEWRIKHHAEEPFFRWLSRWAMVMTKPSDLGYSDDGFVLPPLNITPVFVAADDSPDAGRLFFMGLSGLGHRVKVRTRSIAAKLRTMEAIIRQYGAPVVNDEKPCYRFGYENSQDAIQQGISRQVLSRTQGSAFNRSEDTAFQSNSRTEGELQRIHATIPAPQSGQMETNPRTEREDQRTPPPIICTGRMEANCFTQTGERMAQKQSTETEGAAAKRLSNDPRAISPVIKAAELSVPNMRPFRHGQSKILSAHRSLPQDGDREGLALSELQSRSRQVQRRPQNTEGRHRLFDRQCVIWCGLDKEQRALEQTFGDDCISIYGRQSPEEKESYLERFLSGDAQFLITKTRICGLGLNFQNASQMIFFGMSDSWETYYQGVRREWRFGQTRPVDVYLLLSDFEREIYDNILRKDKQAQRLKTKMIELLREPEMAELHGASMNGERYEEDVVMTADWTAMLGDSCVRMREIGDNSADMSIYSPPFADLFVYSNTDRDLGNCRGWDEFFRHYEFIVRENLRVTKPGRLSCVHTSDIPAMANRDGYIGLRDFPGRVIGLHEECGWTFVGRCFVQKNPQAQAIRVKSKSLLFIQINKDSSHSRPALVDQILIFKKPGENKVSVTPVQNGELNNETWISWAHGIWTDINETDTLQYYHARGKDDEKHICPLQLGTIERCIKLYSNPGETVLTPFMGIGSEAFMAVKLGRKALGIELKRDYFDVAMANLKSLQRTLF